MKPTAAELAGMTTNERLVVSGKTDEFDRARVSRDVQAIRAILKSLDVDDHSIAVIIRDACPPM